MSTSGTKRKAEELDNSVITAQTLQSAGVESIVSSAETESELEALLSFCAKLQTAADANLKVLKRSSRVCVYCDEEADGHCESCDSALCPDCLFECVECHQGVCANCAITCDFDDKLGGKGCGEHLCDGCVVSTECEREVQGCQECLDEYDCPDCDQCAGC